MDKLSRVFFIAALCMGWIEVVQAQGAIQEQAETEPVQAQEGAEPPAAGDDVETPSALEEALVCLARGDLRCARRDLRRVAEGERSAEAAYYWSVSERLAGQSVEAADVVRRILEGEFGRLEARQEQRLRELRDALEEEIARLRLRVRGPTEASLFVDGAAREGTEEGMRLLLLNPGRRVLLVEAPRYEPLRRELDVSVGEQIRLDLTMDATEAVPLRKRGVFWAVLAASVVVVSGIAAGLIYAYTTEASPQRDTPFRRDEL